MRTIRLGRTEERVSAISMGTWSHGGAKTVDGRAVGWSGSDDEEARAALRAAWRSGIRHWDTADAYGDGHSERLIGSLWGDVPRRDIFLATKVGWVAGEFDHFYDPALIRRQFEASLRNLEVDHVDLYYLHHCDFGPEDRYLDGALELVHRFRDEGKVRFVGLSDWDSAKVARLVPRVDPDVVQPYRNLLDDGYEQSGLAERVRERDLGAAFFSPLKHGLLLGKYERPASFPEGDMRNGIDGFRDPQLIAALFDCRKTIEGRFPGHPQAVLQAILEGLLADSPTACVLLGLRNPAQAEAAAAASGLLTPDDALWVRGLYRDLRGSGGASSPRDER